MSLLERVDNVRKLWKMLLPSCPAPEDYWVARWVSRFSDPEIEFAVARTAQRFRNAPSDPPSAGRYCTGVLNNERQNRKGDLP